MDVLPGEHVLMIDGLNKKFCFFTASVAQHVVTSGFGWRCYAPAKK